MLLEFSLATIIIIAMYILTNSYIYESGVNTVILVFFSIIGFACYILIGLQITRDLTDLTLIFIYWIGYTILVITIMNIFMLGYFWSVVRKKTGPYGLRGPVGDIGLIGEKGSCGINSNQSFAIQRITNQLDKLFKEKRDDSSATLLKNNLEPINDYLNDKINSMVSSKQYKTAMEYLTAEKIPLDGFYTYLTNIWSVWFELLYDASSGDWFLDQYADENFEFESETNPFDEIRKYDIFYWGMIDGFRRLKVEVCNETIERPSSEFEPRLKIIVSNDYDWHWNDQGSRAERDVTTYMLKKVQKDSLDYYPIGVVGENGYEFGPKGVSEVDSLEFPTEDRVNGPSRSSILVAGDVKPPARYEKIGYVGGKRRGWIWRPVGPEGYTCMGDLWGYWYNETSNEVPPEIKDRIRCVPSDCVEEVPYYAPELGADQYMGIWNQDNGDDWNKYMVENKNSGKSMEDNGYHVARVRGPNIPYPFYKIKARCLSPIKVENKDLEEQYSKMAIGWNGTPPKSGEKYSIFSLLGLVPEGVITNMQNGRRYYVIHYGGVEVNRYLILMPSKDQQKYTNAVEVNSDRASSKAYNKPLVRNNIYQQWVMKRDSKSKKIYFSNFFNGKNLSIDLEPRTGEEIFSTNTSLTNKNLFNFISSYGEKQIV